MIQKFLLENASAIFALVGTIAGAVLSFFATWLLRKRELKLRLLEKVLDRRINAHEAVIGLSKKLRYMTDIDSDEGRGVERRFPLVLRTKTDWTDWLLHFSTVVNESSTWLSNGVTRELYLLQDYQTNLDRQLASVKDEDLRHAGTIVRQDFIDFSSSIEKLAFKFFAKDLLKLRLSDINVWHKYPKKETLKRLNATVLFTKKDQLQELTNATG